MYPVKKSVPAILCIILLFSILLGGCTDNQKTTTPTPTEPTEPVKNEPSTMIREHLRIGTNAFTKGLEATRTSNADAQLQYSIYDALIMRDPSSKDLKFIPGLAESWKLLSPTVWEFKLRENVKFHDGAVMSAEDVAFSLNRIFENKDPRFDSAYGRYFNTFEKVEIIDSATVLIHLKQPDPLAETFLSDLSGAITSKSYIERVGADAADLKPVGTGPYKVVSFVPGQSAVLERFDDYWGNKAPIQKVTFTYIPEIASRVTAMANNEIDMVIGIPTDQEASLKSSVSGIKLIDTAYPLYHVLVMNMSNKYMGSHPKLRQALDMSIDREALNRALWNGKGIVPTSLQFPDYGDMYLPDVKTIEYNVEKAKQLVKESGYDGTPIVIANRAEYYVNIDLALQAIIEMWKDIGVNAKLLLVPDVNAIPDPEVMIRTWSNPLYYPDPMGLIDASWSDTIWVSTRGLWKPQDPEWSVNFKTARFSTDVNERKKAIRNLNHIAKNEAGFSLLYVPHEFMAVQKDISYTIPKNYRAYTIGLRAGEVSFAN